MTASPLMRSLLALPAAFIVLLLPACRSTRPVDPAAPGAPAKWSNVNPTAIRAEDRAAVDAFYKNGGTGGFHLAPDQLNGPLTAQNASFIVDLDSQQAYLYQGNRLAAYSAISSGQKYYRTETGDYTIGQKDLNHRSTTYGNFVSRGGGTVMSDVQAGFDPTPSGARFEGALMKYFMRLHHNGSSTAMGFHAGKLPGYPASHGCIRLPAKMADWFFQNVPLGTPVSVIGTKNGVPIGHSQNRPKRSPKVHSSLKRKPTPKTVPPAPESDVNTPESPATPPAPAPADTAPTPAPAPEPTPAPAPAPEPAPAIPGIPADGSGQ